MAYQFNKDYYEKYKARRRELNRAHRKNNTEWAQKEKLRLQKYAKKQLVSNGSAAVYIIGLHKQGIPHYKIGMSTRPKERLHDLQTGNPLKLHIRHTSTFNREDALNLEYHLHQKLKPFNLQNEWFELSDQQVNEIIYLTASCAFEHRNGEYNGR